MQRVCWDPSRGLCCGRLSGPRDNGPSCPKPSSCATRASLQVHLLDPTPFLHCRLRAASCALNPPDAQPRDRCSTPPQWQHLIPRDLVIPHKYVKSFTFNQHPTHSWQERAGYINASPWATRQFLCERGSIQQPVAVQDQVLFHNPLWAWFFMAAMVRDRVGDLGDLGGPSRVMRGCWRLNLVMFLEIRTTFQHNQTRRRKSQPVS